MKFAVDSMLGRLAKYLRFLGYDTFYSNNLVDDLSLIKICRDEDRILLTRDKELAKRYENSYYVKSPDYKEQIRDIFNKFSLNFEQVLTMCSVCNVKLQKIDKNYVRDKVPEIVYSSHDEFFICPKCKRIYWEGSHTKKILETLKELGNNENN